MGEFEKWLKPKDKTEWAILIVLAIIIVGCFALVIDFIIRISL